MTHATLVFDLFLVQARILARQYKELSEKEMRKWEKKAAEDKLRYQEQMKHYVPMDDPNAGGKRKKAKKDPNAPKVRSTGRSGN